ncbi:MAG: hypothetical protein H6721_02265 [Sandaracinus sp.]|nr:hypothetical protein [Sandaracinus sp.]MCB9624481.1 hypothetical protein [Sandaracinus sp.]MCB9630963.1 hypothetical protein [Sandaracinus sp.]
MALLVSCVAVPASADFSWSAPEECPSEAVLRGEVERLLGGPLGDDTPDVRARVSRRGESWRLRLRVGTEGERRLEARTCTLLAEATALIVALAIDPVRVVETTEVRTESPSELAPPMASPVEGPPVEPPTETTDETFDEEPSPAEALASPAGGVPGEALVRAEEATATDRTRAVEPPVDRAVSVEPSELPPDPLPLPESPERPAPPPLEGPAVLVVAGVELGGLPAASGIFGLDLSLPVGRFRVEAGVHVAIPREATASGDAELGARLGLGVVRGAVGLPFAFGALRLAPRVALELGVTGGRGFGVSNPVRGLTAWAAVGAGVAGDVRVGRRGSVGLVADALVPVWRPAFVVEPAGNLHRASPVVGRLGLRFGLHWR